MKSFMTLLLLTLGITHGMKNGSFKSMKECLDPDKTTGYMDPDNDDTRGYMDPGNTNIQTRSFLGRAILDDTNAEAKAEAKAEVKAKADEGGASWAPQTGGAPNQDTSKALIIQAYLEDRKKKAAQNNVIPGLPPQKERKRSLGEGCNLTSDPSLGFNQTITMTRKEIMEAQDESCREDLVCAKKGVDGRDFGDCSNSKGWKKKRWILPHTLCCSLPTCRYYKEEKSRKCPPGFTSKPDSDSRPVFYPGYKLDNTMKTTDLEFEQACCMKDGIEHDIMYDPKDMEGQRRSEEKTVEDCRKRCCNVEACAHFSWWERDGGCHLQDADAKPRWAHAVTAGGPDLASWASVTMS
jgi:hypothetical protein